MSGFATRPCPFGDGMVVVPATDPPDQVDRALYEAMIAHCASDHPGATSKGHDYR